MRAGDNEKEEDRPKWMKQKQKDPFYSEKMPTEIHCLVKPAGSGPLTWEDDRDPLLKRLIYFILTDLDR